jgi:hypothetical protein
MRLIRPAVLLCVASLAGCHDSLSEYTAVAAMTSNGIARNGHELRAMQGQTVRVWGFVDRANLYGDGGAKTILGEWWSGAGPDPTTWRFNLKASETDATGHSFPVHVRNDDGRDALLKAIVEDARAQRSTRVYVTGTLRTFEAPTNAVAQTGLYLELQGSRGIRLSRPPET